MAKLILKQASSSGFNIYHKIGLFLSVLLVFVCLITPTKSDAYISLSLDESELIYSSNKTDEEYCLEHPSCAKLAQAIFFESRGEPLLGQYYVAFVVMNRVTSKGHPNTISKVIEYKRRGICHFSYICQIKNKNTVIRKELEQYEIALKVAYDVYFAQTHLYLDADHFYNRKKVGDPVWSKNMEFVARVGDHWFYKAK